MAAEVFFVAIASLVVAQKSLRALKSEPGSCGSSRSLLEDSGSSLLDDSAEELDSETSLDEDASSDELEAISLLDAGATEDEELSAGSSLKELATFSLLEEAFSASLEAGTTEDEDYRSNLLLYRNVHNYAIGHGCAADWEEKAKDLAGRFIKNFKKYEGNEAGKALVSAGPQL